ncbi:MAG: bifunctional histidinol-phosphatase/imidazoleglycerol-phosphate dehydratase HisB [Candidatus Cyclobacteriaceae bacterium M2_1C_046]
MKKHLFIDRDGTLIDEPKDTFQIDSLEKLEFIPYVFKGLSSIVDNADYALVMITNQDGLGTDSFPEEDFWPAHNKMLKTFKNEGITFDDILIDRSFEHENLPTRKPGIGLVKPYMSGDFDLKNSYVIGDRLSDIQLAKNMGCKGILFNNSVSVADDLKEIIALQTESWLEIAAFLTGAKRIATVRRKTKETDIAIELNLDGTGKPNIDTGLRFFDHMLEQLSYHGNVDLNIKVKGDLDIDEHHTIEDTAIALGQAFNEAIGDKRGIERYGYTIPMDDALAQVAIDFSGRRWLVWEAEFNREHVGDMPTEMFYHFFKSFSDEARCNLHISVKGDNEHHKIEAIFKGLARAIKMAVKRDPNNKKLPSTKGIL